MYKKFCNLELTNIINYQITLRPPSFCCCKMPKFLNKALQQTIIFTL